jgi:hypothetical protein
MRSCIRELGGVGRSNRSRPALMIDAGREKRKLNTIIIFDVRRDQSL